MKKNQSKANNKNIDLPDSSDDKKHLQTEETILDLPEVKDIPGQEHVRPLPAGEMADTTISSADEEADYLFDDDEDLDNQANVTKQEAELLKRSNESMATEEDEDIRRAAVDNTDFEGTPLNETNNVSGSDLDVPGSEDDDENEEIGEEDEENNSFSIPDQGKR